MSSKDGRLRALTEEYQQLAARLRDADGELREQELELRVVRARERSAALPREDVASDSLPVCGDEEVGSRVACDLDVGVVEVGGECVGNRLASDQEAPRTPASELLADLQR